MDEVLGAHRGAGGILDAAIEDHGLKWDANGNVTVPDAARPYLIEHLKNRRDIAADNLDDEKRGEQKLDRVQRARYRVEQLGAEKLLAALEKEERPAPKKATPPPAPKPEPEAPAAPQVTPTKRGPIKDTTERAKVWGREHGWSGYSGGWVRNESGSQRVQGWDEVYRTHKAQIDKWEQDRLKARDEELHQRDVAKAAKKAAAKFLPPLSDGTQRKSATNVEVGDVIRIGGNPSELGVPSRVTKVERDGSDIRITREDGTVLSANPNTAYWLGTEPRKGERFPTPTPEPAKKAAPAAP